MGLLSGLRQKNNPYKPVVGVVEVERGGFNKFLASDFDVAIDYQWGRWVFPVQDFDMARDICVCAVGAAVCPIAEMNKFDSRGVGVSFYVYGCDMQGHRAILDFLLDNELVSRDGFNMYAGVAFHPLSEKYSSERLDVIKLEDMIDTYSGEWSPRLSSSDLSSMFCRGSNLHKIYFLGQHGDLLRQWGVIE